MSGLEYWVGAALLAAVRCAHREHITTDRWLAVSHYWTRKGGYRSLRFKLNSHAFHQRLT